MRNIENLANPFANIRFGTVDSGGFSDGSLPSAARPNMEKISMADLDWEGAMPVKSVGFRILIPVPDLGSESQVHTIKNWKGEDEQIAGYKFRNLTDSADQAVAGNGTGVIIVALDPEKTDIHAATQALFTKVLELGGAANLNVAKLDALLGFIRKDLKVSDIYNSNDSIADSMAAQPGYAADSSRPFGLFEKIDKPGPVAVFVNRSASVLDGPHAASATYENGFLAVKIPAKKEGQEPTFRSIAPEAVAYCCKNENGEALIFSQMPQR